MESIRVDKWLWTVRLLKSRSQATKLCKENKVKIKDKIVKPSALVVVGDTVEVKKQGFNLTFRVDQILKSRVGAVLAVDAYKDMTPEEELNKYKAWFVGKAAAEMRERGEGRPTKKDRREIEDFKVGFNPEDYELDLE